MSKRRQNIMILVGLLVLAFIGGFAYWMWVKSIALPILGEIEEYQSTTVSGESFAMEKGKIKLISVAESGCPANCEEKLKLLEDLQQELIDEKAFISRVFIVTVLENENDAAIFQERLKTYNVDEKGWKIVTLKKNVLTNLLERIEQSKKEDEGWLTLVDANGRIRQHYNIENRDEKEQLIKDVKHMIRIQQQSIEERRENRHS